MFFGGTGPFVATFVQALGHDRLRHVATHASLMTLQHVLKSVAFGLLGFAFGEWLPLVGMMILAGFLGTAAGKRILVRTDERRFRVALNALLIILALRLIWAGGIGLVGGDVVRRSICKGRGQIDFRVYRYRQWFPARWGQSPRQAHLVYSVQDPASCRCGTRKFPHEVERSAP